MTAVEHTSEPRVRRPHVTVLGDAILVVFVPIVFFILAARVELSERVDTWTRSRESLQLDEVPLALAVLCACLAWFAWRRWHERAREMRARIEAEVAMRGAVQQNRELTHQLLRLQEDERARIARELHDELAQLCVGIRVEAAGISDEARARDLAAVDAGAQAIRDSVDRLQAAIRDMLVRLRPPVLDALGLEASLRALASEWSMRHGIACSVQIDARGDALADELRVALYRLAQEALTNVARHAHASSVRLALQSEQDRRFLLLSVEDDGRGLAEGDKARGGLGLVGMSERAAALGGHLELGPSARGGLRVAVRLPAGQVPAKAVETAA